MFRYFDISLIRAQADACANPMLARTVGQMHQISSVHKHDAQLLHCRTLKLINCSNAPK